MRVLNLTIPRVLLSKTRISKRCQMYQIIGFNVLCFKMKTIEKKERVDTRCEIGIIKSSSRGNLSVGMGRTRTDPLALRFASLLKEFKANIFQLHWSMRRFDEPSPRIDLQQSRATYAAIQFPKRALPFSCDMKPQTGSYGRRYYSIFISI
jgi:hypothetical protein